nr:hypothetical protein [Bacteroides intestinalis]
MIDRKGSRGYNGGRRAENRLPDSVPASRDAALAAVKAAAMQTADMKKTA